MCERERGRGELKDLYKAMQGEARRGQTRRGEVRCGCRKERYPVPARSEESEESGGFEGSEGSEESDMAQCQSPEEQQVIRTSSVQG